MFQVQFSRISLTFEIDEPDYSSFILSKKAWYVPKADANYFNRLKMHADTKGTVELDPKSPEKEMFSEDAD